MAPARAAAGLAVARLLLASAYPAYHELFYSQPLDHFDPASTAQWQHRYLLNNDTWDGRGALPNGCRGPILLYTGNEGAIDEFWPGNGFMIEVLAPKLGGLLVFPEERFYGKSLPCGQDSLQRSCLRYLTTAQVLEDFADLLAHLRATLPGAAGCPAVAFGGSYGGTLAALLRASHPSSVTGALASSSELGYYDVEGWASHGVDSFTFEDIVARNYADVDPRCLPAIQFAKEALEATSRDDVAAAFRVCDPQALGPTSNSDLFIYALEGVPQLNYPYPVGGLPANPARQVCELLVPAAERARVFGPVIAAAANVTAMGLGFDSSTCIPNLGVGGPGNMPGDGPGASSWGWQSCTETLHAFSARTLRNYTFDYERSSQQCSELYPPTIRPDTSLLARRYGGYALAEGTAGVTRIIWSQGTLDPWHGWFKQMANPPPGSGVHHILMRGAAHHLDLKSPNAADPPDVTAARALETAIIAEWIREAGAAAPAAPAAPAATPALVV